MAPRVLVLGAGPLRDRFFLTAAAMGVRTVAVDDSVTPRYDRLCDETCPLRLSDDADRARLEELAGKSDGVIALSDRMVPVAAALAARWGLPGCGTATVARGHDKAAVREALAAAEADFVGFRRVRTGTEAADFLRTTKLGSAVVKPVDGTASLGVRLVTGPREAAAACAELGTGPDGLLIEEYLLGPEVSIEAVVRGGRVIWHTVTDKVTSPGPQFIELRHTVGGPSNRLGHVGARPFLQAVIDALGIDDAIVHAEAKCGPADWRLVEIGVRPAGGLIVDLVRQATGLDLYAELLRLALGQPSVHAAAEDDSGHFGQGSGLYAAVHYVAGRGVVRDFPSMAPVFDGLDTVCGAERLLPPGAEIGDVHSNRLRAGYVRACSADRDRLDTQLIAATRRLTRLLGLETS
jgi:hypothetical protein